MWIYLLRHGIAEDPRPGRSDEERELTAEGHERLARCAPAWRRLVKAPAVVVTSPLARARQTTDAFVEAVDFTGEVRVDDAVTPMAETMRALTMLEGEQLGGTDSVAIVGHEPHLGYLLGALLTGNRHLSVPLKKGMLVAVETSSPASVVAGLRFSLTQKAAARLR